MLIKFLGSLSTAWKYLVEVPQDTGPCLFQDVAAFDVVTRTNEKKREGVQQ